MRHNELLKEKVYESVGSVLPITAIVLILSISITPLNPGILTLFFFGAVMLIIGMGLFTLGVDMSMIPMGEGIGVRMSRGKKIGISLLISFVLGVIITIAEPDLTVLANQVPSIPNMTLILTVALGVGVFMVVAQLRMLLKIRLSYVLIVFYALVFLFTYFTPNNFIAVSFDSGGVTTGPITVPFVIALGIGMASVRSDKNSESDSFGLTALCSIGPIIAVMLLGICYQSSEASYTKVEIASMQTTKDVAEQFAAALPGYLKEVSIALIPILVMFFLFQLVFRRFKRRQLIRITAGLIYTYVGLVLFLTGVNVGFMPAGQYIGAAIGGGANRWLLVPIGALIGYFIVKAEPAVQVLTKQVEEITNGSVTQRSIGLCLSVGIAFSVGISMLRILTGISILWFLIPGYLIALLMTFRVPGIFTGIAFDSGGVASGPMTTTFLLPFAMGACEAVGGNVLTDAFGIVAMVAMTPLCAIQAMGMYHVLKKKKERKQMILTMEEVQDDILFFE